MPSKVATNINELLEEMEKEDQGQIPSEKVASDLNEFLDGMEKEDREDADPTQATPHEHIVVGQTHGVRNTVISIYL